VELRDPSQSGSERMGSFGVDTNKRAVTEEQVHLFIRTFVNRWEAPFPIQNSDGSYTYVLRTLERKHVRMHLEGKLTLGLLVGEDGKTKFGVVDIDCAIPDVITAVWEKCYEFGLSYFTVFSGRKGYHVIVLFDKPTDAKKAEAVMKLVGGEHEIWPR
jgi:hypothetical protein